MYRYNGIGFSSKKVQLERHIAPKVAITVDGKSVEMPQIPVRSTNQNGFVNVENYVINQTVAPSSVIKATADGPVSIEIQQPANAPAKVICTYNGQRKIYNFDPSLVVVERPRGMFRR